MGILYTFISCVYSISLTMTRFFHCFGIHNSKGLDCFDEPSHLLNFTILMSEAIVFGIFTSCMLIDQWDGVLTNTTHIDRLKGHLQVVYDDIVTETSALSSINEVFGIDSRRNQRGPNFKFDWL